MIGKLKFLILLVALVAVPLRGMAAVAMWHCAQGQGEASASMQDHASHHAQDEHEVAPHAHGSPDHGDADGQPTQGAAASCSACSACCMGGSIAPTSSSGVSLAPVGASRIDFVERRFAGVVPARIERPPFSQSL